MAVRAPDSGFKDSRSGRTRGENVILRPLLEWTPCGQGWFSSSPFASVTEHDEAVRRHGYHRLRVKGVVQETKDARSLVLDVPAELRDMFVYQPGQFCSFRVRIGEDEHARCYSMSSAPEVDGDLTVTVKRVPGGIVSNRLIDQVSEGDTLEVTSPSGVFCVRSGDRPIVALCGGSGITPVISIAKSVLAASDRPVRLLYANRDSDSIIFDRSLAVLQRKHPERFVVQNHLDSERGFLDAASIRPFVGCRLQADFYICGPGPFMDLVEETLLGLGVSNDDIFIERFTKSAEPGPQPQGAPEGADTPEKIAVILRGKRNEIPYRAGETVLETARRASLPTPYSCEAGNCATCMAFVREGTVTMRANNALTPEEVAEGWVLTCQALPASSSLTVEYEPL
jgi:ferredoxin-NADP reductase